MAWFAESRDLREVFYRRFTGCEKLRSIRNLHNREAAFPIGFLGRSGDKVSKQF
jgi:hypothetical protein